MKKFFSLLCATLLVFSASAAPVAKKAELAKKAVAVEQMQKVQFEKAQSVKTLSLENVQLSKQLSATPAVKVNNFKSQALAKAPQATQAEPIVVIIKGNPQIVSKSGKTTIEATGNDDIIYGWVISTESLEAGKTYTYADMGAYNVYRYDNSFTVYEDATDGTFSIDAENNITASMVTESGTYLVYTNDPTPQPSYDTIPVTVAAYQAKYYASSLDWQVLMADAAGNVYSFDIFAPAEGLESGKTYTSDNDDFDLDYTYAAVNKVSDAAVKASFTKTVSATAIEVVAEMTTAGNKVYQFNYTEKIIQWSEWESFAPLGKNSGAWTYAALLTSPTDIAVSNIVVRYDKENANAKQIKVPGWGAALFGTAGVDLIIDWNAETNACVIEEQPTSYSYYGYDVVIYTTENGSYDPQTATFTLPVDYNVSGLMSMGDATEYLKMDATIASYDTIPVTIPAYGYSEEYYGSTKDWYITLKDANYNSYIFDIFAPEEGLENGKTYAALDDFDLTYTFANIEGKKDLADSASFTKTETAETITIVAELFTKGGKLYQISFEKNKTGLIVDANGIIYQPEEGTVIEYNRLGSNNALFVSNGKLSYGPQSGTSIMVECADNVVYWQDPISHYGQGTWIKGKKEGSTITFPAKQLIYDDGSAIYGIHWGLQTNGKISAADDYADNLIFDIKGDSLILRGSTPFVPGKSNYLIGIFIEDATPAFSGYGDCGVNLYIPGWKPSTELITPPAGLVTEKLPYTAIDATSGGDDVKDSVLVGWDVDTVYVQGLCPNFPNSWVKGTLEEDIVTFDAFQFVGKYYSYDIWLAGTPDGLELSDYHMTYNAQGNYFIGVVGEYMIENAAYDQVYNLSIYSGLTIGTIATRDTVYFSGQGVVISECTDDYDRQTGWFYEVTDASTGYRFMLQSTVVAEKYGTFSYADKTLGNGYYNVFDPKGNRQQFKEGSITVTEGEDGSITLVGELIAEDEKVYVLNFVQPAGTLQGDTDAPFDATFAWSDMSTFIDNGVISISATNAEGLAIGLELYADPTATTIPAGTYTISDTQEAGTALQSVGIDDGYLTECFAGTRGASGINVPCWFLVDGTITLSYDEYGKLKVVVDAKNSYDQPVTALVQYVKLEPKSTVTITDGELAIDEEMYAQYGITTFIALNENYGFILPIYADTIVGDFTEDLEYALAKVVNLASLAPSNIIDVESIVVTGIEKNITLNAKVLGADTIMYEITATGYLGYIDGDAKEVYKGEFAIEDVTFVQDTKTQVMIYAFNEAGDTLALVIKAKLNDAGLLDAGEYTDIQASTGWTQDGLTDPSFVENDSVSWFIQSGKLTVAEDGSMVFEGINSYDKSVVIDFTVPTGLRNTKANVKAAKQIKNGQIIIVRENKEYNILGAAL